MLRRNITNKELHTVENITSFEKYLLVYLDSKALGMLVIE
ncbi:hypothetical protein RINTHH_6010 [Richelia intracellularis HH01]|uniref:Uncharacterized protein n=1 Tax=Richelia intracellularis HH01 TaxID=1165094 RepID=M1X4V6_9NOST|nr:hypothetical protein RINTHH_6010 [Richelia intracellularis HH01]